MANRSVGRSNRLTPNHPIRGADRNRKAPAEDGDAGDASLLPSLKDGITLLDVEGGRGVEVLQSLVLDHLLMTDGPAFWIDSQGYATTASLARIAPSQRLLERVNVARGFTPYQHYAAVETLPSALSRGSTESSGQSPSLLVAPAFDSQYAGSDSLHDEHASTLQARGLARLAGYARQFDAPVLVTRTDESEFTTPIENAADHQLTCEQTKAGPRFIGDDFETLLYPEGDEFYQTTLAFWNQILGERARQVGLEPASPGTPSASTSGTGIGVAAGENGESLSTDPLLDAWQSHGGR